MDLDRFATLRAELDAGKDLSEALAFDDVGESAWHSIEVEWLTRIAVAAASADFALTERYNRAFDAARRRMGLSADAVGPPPSAPESAIRTPRHPSDPSEWAASPFQLASPGAKARPRPADAVAVLPFSGGSAEGEPKPPERSDSAPPRKSSGTTTMPSFPPTTSAQVAAAAIAEEPAPAANAATLPLTPPVAPAAPAPTGAPVAPTPWATVPVPPTPWPPPLYAPVADAAPDSEIPETRATYELSGRDALPFESVHVEETRAARPRDVVPVLPFVVADNDPDLSHPEAHEATAEDDGGADELPLELTMDDVHALDGHGLPFGPGDQRPPVLKPLLTMEQFASLSAELTCAERNATLHRYQLDERVWLAEQHAWQAAFQDEANLLHRYEELLRVYVDYLRQRAT